jgi:hypothetical protein
MAPVKRGPAARPAPSRRAATPPVQQRRNPAAQPPARPAPSQVAETTPFDAQDGETEEGFLENEEELPQIVDLSAVEATTYEVIPRGVYSGYVDSIEYGLSQSKGLPMLTWTLKFDYEDKERTLRYYTTLAGDGAGRTKATLARLDPDLDLSQLVPDEMDEHFSGMEVRIRVTIRPDRDDRKIKRNNVADLMPLDEDFAE